MSPSARTAARHKRAVESFGNAATALGEISPGMSLFALTRGQWSMIDAILHCLDQVGPAWLSVWTWTVATYEVEVLDRLRRDDRLTGARLVIDKGAQKKNASIIEDWQRRFGEDAVRWTLNHAKIARISSSSGLKLLLRGSMNLNFNPRFEQFDITEGGDDYELVRRVEEELPAFGRDVTLQDIYKASKVSDAFDAEELDLFRGGLKTWAK